MYVNEYIKEVERVKNHEDRTGYLKLDMNENPEGLPSDFFNKVKELITPELVSCYPQKERLISLIAEQEAVNSDGISIVNGSDEGIKLVFETFTKPGGNVVTVTPSFELYNVYSKMFGLENRTIEYDKDFSLSIHRISESIDENTHLVVLLNPNSPIGNTYSDEEFETIISKANRVGAIVLIDEAYYYFGAPSKMEYVNKYQNVLVLRTFSKLCSIAGLRIGFLCGDSQLIKYVDNAQLSFNVNSIAILFAEQMLLHPQIIETLIKIQEKGRNYIVEQLDRHQYQYYAQCGNYILIKPKKDAYNVSQELKEQGVLIKTYRQPILQDWIRITIGSEKLMNRFWNTFQKVEEGHK